MKYYLAKTEPSVYSIDDLERDGSTTWDGVTNPQAVKAILAMRPGDRVYIYHSGGVSAVVGIAKVKGAGREDPKNPKSAVADLEYEGRVDPPVTLAETFLDVLPLRLDKHRDRRGHNRQRRCAR